MGGGWEVVARRRMYSEAFEEGLGGLVVVVEEEERVRASMPRPTVASPETAATAAVEEEGVVLSLVASFRAEGGGVRGVVEDERFVCRGHPSALCIRLRRPPPPPEWESELPPLLPLLVWWWWNGSQSEVCAGVDRIPLFPTVSASPLNRFIDVEGDGEEAKNKR